MWPFDVIRAFIIRCASGFYEPHWIGGKVSDVFQEIFVKIKLLVFGKRMVNINLLAVFIILVIASYRFIEHKNEKNRTNF